MRSLSGGATVPNAPVGVSVPRRTWPLSWAFVNRQTAARAVSAHWRERGRPAGVAMAAVPTDRRTDVDQAVARASPERSRERPVPTVAMTATTSSAPSAAAHMFNAR